MLNETQIIKLTTHTPRLHLYGICHKAIRFKTFKIKYLGQNIIFKKTQEKYFFFLMAEVLK